MIRLGIEPPISRSASEHSTSELRGPVCDIVRMAYAGLKISVVFRTFFAISPLFLEKPYSMTTHKNRLDETILMNGHTIGFRVGKSI